MYLLIFVLSKYHFLCKRNAAETAPKTVISIFLWRLNISQINFKTLIGIGVAIFNRDRLNFLLDANRETLACKFSISRDNGDMYWSRGRNNLRPYTIVSVRTYDTYISVEKTKQSQPPSLSYILYIRGTINTLNHLHSARTSLSSPDCIQDIYFFSTALICILT